MLKSCSFENLNMTRKGIVLAGGSGTRLHPVTKGVSKQLIPVYDKPMIYYSLSVLMLAGINEILLISTPHDINSYKNLLGDGAQFGCKFSYDIQPEPKGIAQAFTVGERFIGDEQVALVLGDNLFHGAGFSGLLKKAHDCDRGATIFGISVKDPERYGVAEIDEYGNVLSIEEKPDEPRSNLAVTGLYFYDNDVIDIAKSLTPSERGEYEITAINNTYLARKKLKLEVMPRGMTWLDTGTHESMMKASQFIYAVEKRSGVKIGCLEEIALSNGWVDLDSVHTSAISMGNSSYAKYLSGLHA